MRPTGWELYNNLELMIELYRDQGLPAAKTRLHSIALMVHEVRAVLRAKERVEKELKGIYTSMTSKHAPKEKYAKLRNSKRLATLKASMASYERYEERAWPVINARIAKLPTVTCSVVLKKRPNNHYIKKVFTWNLQARRFNFWDPIT